MVVLLTWSGSVHLMVTLLWLPSVGRSSFLARAVDVARLGTAQGAVVLSAARVPGSCLDLEGLPFGELGKGD